MHIHLSERFSYGKLLRFTMPSVIMMIFTSLYGVADGFFVSNFAGKNPFTAVNFIMPFLMVLGAMGFMFGTGGSAIIAKTMGEGDDDIANRQFSLLIYTTLICGVIVAALGIIFIRPVASLMGAEGELLENCVLYGRIILLALPFYMLQFEFQSFFSTAEKPRLGLVVTIAAGMANIIGDALLVAVFRFGIVGAAAATALSQAVGGIIPLFYFAFPNTSRLKLTKTRLDFRVLAKVCTNGSSELMSNVSMSLVNMLYNVQLMKYAGEDGVAAYGTLMYVNLVFLAAFIGYSVGTAPIVSFHYGAEDHAELKSLLKKSHVIISVFAVMMFANAELLARPLA
ncbi:MAG: polysaccharide biosynthesis C-terminal domain-containing protein, partial [Oscillospiraceae bacterium]|nr:polysaccharide biosynthesis C-terminal domain-containing protein [Oscillospiraceae bacterium]